MKKFSLILLFIAITISGIYAQPNRKYRDAGILFEVSNNPNWGYGEPVITHVQPFSSADKAGLKRGDIIMEINGMATYLRNNVTIASWLTGGTERNMTLTVRNINTYFKEFPLETEVRTVNSLSEFDLASAYSFYSIETTNDRSFTLPARVDPNTNVDFSDYHTFDFINEGTSVPDADHYINQQIEQALIERGLVRDTKDPDIIVQSYYSYQPNVKYNASSRSKNQKTWRYDSEIRQMVQVPILSAEDPNAEAKGEYILELGIRFFDRKFISTEKMTQIWDCKTTEYLTEDYALTEYARLHAPLMLMQYPYSVAKTTAKYIVSFKSFNYTGMNFDNKDLKTITTVDENSPAYNAGIRAGAVIESINGVNFKYTKDEIDNGYRRFIIESMKFRNPKTRFIDANGFPDCMLWSVNKYADAANLFKKESLYMPCFSYLYAFQKFVSEKPSKSIQVEIKDGSSKKSITIVPELQTSVTIKAL
ncbi:PDZ domain-containing protein [Dysgonomonas macrotermitis]|uniref:PDZ domain (Also known as DHR or GLGF) n=1 Tax=Dysgonomonas macrotermitis TaxID=1346286 RepID=A0A1M5EPN3_9BACT|nr:PDZ domain-containing protein [Dysgonomonas macrotermitis]SHF81104.1 PDZ domain (Also known as DHR or GLGF) [Dysgonomonas macrotermitis]